MTPQDGDPSLDKPPEPHKGRIAPEGGLSQLGMLEGIEFMSEEFDLDMRDMTKLAVSEGCCNYADLHHLALRMKMAKHQGTEVEPPMFSKGDIFADAVEKLSTQERRKHIVGSKRS